MSVKKIARNVIIGTVALFVIVLLFNSFFFLNEWENAIVKRFGSIEAVYVKTASQQMVDELKNSPAYSLIAIHEGTGIKFKLPFIDTVTKRDSRLITYDTQPREINTSDKKRLTFDNCAQWKITNPVYFEVALTTATNAEAQIDRVLYSRMNEKVGRIDAHGLITNRDLVSNMLVELAQETTEYMKNQRYGIEVADVRIKRTDYPTANHASIYQRMTTERERIAAQYRSEGDEESVKVRSNTDKDVAVIVSEAKKQAEIIKGQGDSEAARVFNEAYGNDPDFFAFYNLLDVYRNTLKEKTTMVIPSDSEFAKYLMGSK